MTPICLGHQVYKDIEAIDGERQFLSSELNGLAATFQSRIMFVDLDICR
jgi:hypothetical protein